MAKNILAAQVNTSIMEGTESTFSVDVKDYLGADVDISLITLRFSIGDGEYLPITWNAELSVHELTFPALREGSYEYRIYELEDTGDVTTLVTGVIGVFNRDNWQEPVLSSTSPNRTLRIVKADEKGQIEATWMATSAAAGYAYESRKNADVLRDAMPLILQAAAFMESFDKALRESVRVIDNYLWIGGVNTGHYLRGDDGETPRYGSDGYWYLGDKLVGKARGDDGITPHITADGYWAIGSEKTTTRAAGRDGLDGASMRRILINSVEELPAEEQRGVYYYVKLEEGYDVYVWLEPDGWVCVGEANDIATSELYGLVKLGTDVQVANGAPVGRDAEGQMAVPLAGTAVAGVGKLGNGSTISDGAGVGLNASGALMVGVATTTSSGTIKLGTGNIIDDYGATVGLTASKQAVIPWATESSGGAVRLGSHLGEVNNRPYLVSIGTTDSRKLAFNVLNGGALKHMQGQTGWVEGAAPGTNLGGLSGSSIYFGLDTTEQFTQSGGQLALEEATTSLCAGVYLAASMSDSRTAAVPTSDVVVNYLSEHYYGKSQVYTKQETLTQIDYKLQSYASISWVQDNFVTLTQLQAELLKKVGCASGKINNIEPVTASERENLSSIDLKTFYVVYAG